MTTIVIKLDADADTVGNLQRLSQLLRDAAVQARRESRQCPTKTQDPTTKRYEWSKVGTALDNARVASVSQR